MNINIWSETNSPWQAFIANLDLELFIAGTGLDCREWSGHNFSGDPYWRLYLPLTGEFHLVYPDQVCVVQPGEICLVPAYRPFRFEGVIPSSHQWLHFMSEKLRQLPAFREFRAVSADCCDSPAQLFRQARRQLEAASPIAGAIESKQLLLKLLRPFLEKFGDETQCREGGEFTRVLDYIDLKLEYPLEVSELAGFTRLSRAGFSAEFRRRFGLPPKQYISSRRISRAKQLLLRTSLNNKEIALRCGYENEFFSTGSSRNTPAWRPATTAAATGLNEKKTAGRFRAFPCSNGFVGRGETRFNYTASWFPSFSF